MNFRALEVCDGTVPLGVHSVVERVHQALEKIAAPSVCSQNYFRISKYSETRFARFSSGGSKPCARRETVGRSVVILEFC